VDAGSNHITTSATALGVKTMCQALQRFAPILLLAILGSAVSPKASQQLSSDEKIPTLTVCEALSHASQYDGKLVLTSDRVSGTDEYTAFQGEGCPAVLITDGKVWPSVIVWTMPEDSQAIIHRVNFKFDTASQKRLETKWQQMKGTADSKCVALTYTGMFKVWSKAKARKPVRGGWIEFSGFGHLNGSGAQLILTSADDVSIIPDCKVKQ
jgi:hypothetical protein